MTHWMQIKTLSQAEAPCPRWGHVICAVGDSLYLFGGYENSKYFNDLWKFNLNTLKFSQIEQLGQVPPPCSNFSMNLNQDQSKIILFGGGTLNKEKLNTVYQLNVATNSWKKLTANSQQPQPWSRSYHCSEIIGNYLVVFGGEFFHDLDDLWLFDLEKNSWNQVKMSHSNLKPKARKFASSFQYKNRLYLIGGCHTKYQSVSDAFYLDFNRFLESKQIEDLKWCQLKLNKHEILNRWGHVSVVKNDSAYIFGGRQGNKDLQNLVALDLVTQKPSEILLFGDLPKGRRKPGMCLRNNTLFCHSGFDGSYVKDFFQINLLTRPKFSQKQSLKEQFNFQKIDTHKIAKKEQNPELFYDNNVLKVANTEQRNKLKKSLPNLSASISKKAFCDFVNQSQVITKNPYFINLIDGYFHEEQQVLIPRPQGITQRQYLELLQIFLLYVRYGKIFFNQQTIQDTNKLIENLLELADYYGISHLDELIKEWLVNNFEKNLRSKKIQIKTLVEKAYTLQKYDRQLGQYAGFNSLIKLLKGSNIVKIDQLRVKLKSMTHMKEIDWLIELVGKFEFELQQYAFNKFKVQSQNDIPQVNDWSDNQKTANAPCKWLTFLGIL